MAIFRTLIAFICMTTAAPALASLDPTPEMIAQTIISDLKKGDATATIENMIARAPLITASPAEKTNLINTLNTFLTSYGQVGGWELLRKRSASRRYVEHSYIVFQERYALHLELKFYQGRNGWKLTAFNFNDNLKEAVDAQSMTNLEQALKQSSPKE